MSCGSFLFFRPLSWGNEVEKSCFPIARAAEGGMRSGARGNVCTERRRGEPATRGAAGQREGAERAAEEPHPERTCSEGGDNQGKTAASGASPH